MSGTEQAAAAVVALACVPDMITSILERVPDPVWLFRCSLVCKEWRGLVCDPAFLRRSGMASASLLGILVQRDRPRKITKLFPTIAPVLVPAPGSVLGPQLRFLTSFVRDNDGVLDDATPLAARDGLLLLRVWRPRSSTDKNSSGAGGGVLMLHLCVCNLLTGNCDLLPAFDVDAAFDAGGIQGYGLLTAADIHGAACPPHDPADGYNTLFQVLLVGRGDDDEPPLKLRRFSSASGDWDALDCSQAISGVRDRRYGLWGPDGCHIAAVARGTAHWLFRRDGWSVTIDVSASTGQVSMTAIPVDTEAAMTRATRYKPWWLCTTAEGRLAPLCMETNNRLVMMKQRQRDDGDHHWDPNHVAEARVDVELGFGRESLSPVCIGDRSGIALARSCSDPERRAYVLDIDRQSSAGGSATKVEGWARNFNYMTAVPFEINWAMFFVSRLGVNNLSGF